MKQAVKRLIGSVFVHRLRGVAISLAAGTSSYVLLKAVESPSTFTLTDFAGTNIAQSHPGAHIIKIELHMQFYSLSAGNRIEWALMRELDVTPIITNPSDVITAVDDTEASQNKRKTCLSYGLATVSAAALEITRMIVIHKKALKRNELLEQNDQIKLYINNSLGSAVNFNAYGRIWTREP